VADTLDTELERIVRDELAWHDGIDITEVRVSVEGGHATLSGTVATTHERSTAGEVAAAVAGVRSVDNRIRTDTVAARVVDDDLIASARAALAADPVVPKGRVEVTADDGWLTISGVVSHDFQRRAAERAVRRVPGLQGLTDDIGVNHERA
jgi:osmotically-inducible protein OsmY